MINEMCKLSIGSTLRTNEEMHRQIERRLISQRPENIVPVSIQMWGSMASGLMPIISEVEFMSLYCRSLKLTQISFPTLAPNQVPQKASLQFASLKLSLEGLSVVEASAASKAFFITFIDLLSMLIGVPLTNTILLDLSR